MNEPNQWNWSGEGWVDGGGSGRGEGRDSCDAPTDTCGTAGGCQTPLSQRGC